MIFDLRLVCKMLTVMHPHAWLMAGVARGMLSACEAGVARGTQSACVTGVARGKLNATESVLERQIPRLKQRSGLSLVSLVYPVLSLICFNS